MEGLKGTYRSVGVSAFRRVNPDTPLRRYAVTLILFLCFVAGAEAETPQELFQRGNAAYAQGQFDQAVKFYESMRSMGLRHWVVEYNVGNAYFKAGQAGKSIVSYERAFRLNPGQGDVIYNLHFALTKVGDPLLPAAALPRLFWRLFFGLSLNALTIGASLLFIGVCVGSGLWLLGRIHPTAEAAFVVVLVLLAAGLWAGLRITDAQRHEAIVVVPTAEVRGGPNTSYTANFTVPEGHRVQVLDEQEPVQGWLEIGVPDQGLKGWVPDSSVEVI